MQWTSKLDKLTYEIVFNGYQCKHCYSVKISQNGLEKAIKLFTSRESAYNFVRLKVLNNGKAK